MQGILTQLCSIPSPTHTETKKMQFIKSYITTHCPNAVCTTIGDNLIATLHQNNNYPTIALVGHTDVVPNHFDPYVKNNKLYAPGASDMQAGLATFLLLLSQNHANLKANIVFIAYAREEGTPLHENGLYECLTTNPNLFKTIDCAIVGEPTDNTIQCGCVGSLHAKVTIAGKAAHSARPWHGDNALYKAIPLLECMAKQQPIPTTIQGLTFTNVTSITEATVTPGRTTIPETFTCNINVRFAPDKTSEQALQQLTTLIESTKITDLSIKLIDSVPAGKIIQAPIVDQLIKRLNCPIQAKQAWTDVAQLTQAGIPAFNYGPGQQDQAHKPNEYVDLNMCDDYYHNLKLCLTTAINTN